MTTLRSFSAFRPLLSLLIVGLTVLFLAPALAAQNLMANGTNGEITLSHDDGVATVTLADGQRVALDLPPTARVISLAASGERWYVGAVDEGDSGRSLLLREGAGVNVRPVPSPKVRDAAELREPRLLLDERGLRGLVWIEGKAPRAQTVRAARYDARGWRTVQTVSPVGLGSQMGLAAAALGDGAWLFAWSAFDGQDMEIQWSRWTLGEGPSPAQRLDEDNAVPDIVPKLLSVPGGALLAWNRYDGKSYRTLISRFGGTGSWTAPVAGEKGSLYPTLHSAANGPVVLYQKAWPKAWVVAELNGAGQVQRRASLATSRDERPLIQATTQDVALRWPNVDEAEAARIPFEAVE